MRQPELVYVTLRLLAPTLDKLARRMDTLDRRLSGHLALEPDDADTARMVLERVRLARAALVSARLVAAPDHTPNNLTRKE